MTERRIKMDTEGKSTNDVREGKLYFFSFFIFFSLLLPVDLNQ